MTTIGYRGERLDLTIRQGATFGPALIRIENQPGEKADLTGVSIRAQVRLSPDAAATTAEMELEMLAAEEQYSFSFGLSAAVTAAMPAGSQLGDPGFRQHWDMEMVWPDGRIDPLYYGIVTVHREVTRDA